MIFRGRGAAEHGAVGVAQLSESPSRQFGFRVKGEGFSPRSHNRVSVTWDPANVSYPHACAVERLVLCGITPRPDQGPHQRHAIAKTALGAELTVPWEFESTTEAAVAKAASAGYQIAVVDTSPDAVDLFAWQPRWPVCLVFGHETDGVAHPVRLDATTHVRIPMLGAKASLNVATAAGVVLYELLRKHRYA